MPPLIQKACIQQVQVARRALAMTEADYRAMLQRIAGVSSSKELTHSDFCQVMNEFARLGFISTARSEAAKQESRAAQASSYAQRRKIETMWNAWKGKPDPEGLRRWLEHHHGISHLKFCSGEKARKVIGSLLHFKKKPQAAPSTNSGQA